MHLFFKRKWLITVQLPYLVTVIVDLIFEQIKFYMENIYLTKKICINGDTGV